MYNKYGLEIPFKYRLYMGQKPISIRPHKLNSRFIVSISLEGERSFFIIHYKTNSAKHKIGNMSTVHGGHNPDIYNPLRLYWSINQVY